MRWQRFGLATGLLFLATCCGLLERRVWGQGTLSSLEVIEKAWRARQERVRSAQWSWRERVFWPKGSISAFLVAGTTPEELERRGLASGMGKVMPPKDTIVDFAYRLLLDGEKVRLEYSGQEWAHARQAFRPVQYVSVFGKEQKSCYLEGTGHATWPLGQVCVGPNYRDAHLAAVQPLMLAYRPLAASMMAVKVLQMSVKGKAVIDGRTCMELTESLLQKGSVMYWWLDPEREFVVLRRLVMVNRKPFEEIEIRYWEDKAVGWVPHQWRTISYNASSGKLLCIHEATLEEAVFNGPVEHTAFDITFPPGTVVTDEKTGSSYLIRSDGSRRVIQEDETGMTYEQLRTKVVEESSGFPWRGLLLGLGIAALGLWVGRWFYVRRARFRSNER